MKCYKNFVFLYGSPPKLTIDIETTMVKHLISGLTKQIELQKKFIKVPDVFEDLKSDEGLRFETNASGTLQPLQLQVNKYNQTFDEAMEIDECIDNPAKRIAQVADFINIEDYYTQLYNDFRKFFCDKFKSKHSG